MGFEPNVFLSFLLVLCKPFRLADILLDASQQPQYAPHFVGKMGLEPTFEVISITITGMLDISQHRYLPVCKKWSHLDSNQAPDDYESPALTK